MSRVFTGFSTGTEQHITLAPGNITTDGGPLTVLCYWRPDADHVSSGMWSGLVAARLSGSTTWAMQADGGSYGTNGFNSVAQVVPGDWQIVGYTKPSGSATVRWHVWHDGGWTHTDAGSLADQGAPDSLLIGTFDPPDGRMEGLWVCAAVWNTALGNAAVEAAASPTALQSWHDASPAALWAGNQDTTSDPVVDLTGGGADQTASLNPGVGGADPPGWSYTISSGTEIADTAGHAQLAGRPPTVAVGTTVPGAPGATRLTGQAPIVAAGTTIAADAAAVRTAAREPTVQVGTTVADTPGHTTVVGRASAVQVGATVRDFAGVARLAAPAVTVRAGTTVADAADAARLAGRGASVVAGTVLFDSPAAARSAGRSGQVVTSAPVQQVGTGAPAAVRLAGRPVSVAVSTLTPGVLTPGSTRPLLTPGVDRPALAAAATRPTLTAGRSPDG